MSNLNPNIIFVGGVHGVGKTYYCKNLSKTIGLDHYSCSELIARIKEIDFKNKFTQNISENQNLLELSVNKYLSPQHKYILDGHFCLINNQGNITKVPEATFSKLNISKIIVLENDSDTIIRNLEKRDNKIYDRTLVEKFQLEEIRYAKYISKLLNVNIEVLNLTKFN